MALQASLNYLRPGGDASIVLTPTPGDESPLVPVRCRVSDARARARPLQLKGDGVELVRTPRGLDVAAFADVPLQDAQEAVRPFFEKLACELTGALPGQTFCLIPLYRSDDPTVVEKSGVRNTTRHSSGARPHDFVHSDYHDGFLPFVRGLKPHVQRRVLLGRRGGRGGALGHVDVAADVLRTKRLIVLQFWGSAQPRDTVIEQHSLTVCVPGSVCAEDLVPSALGNYAGRFIGPGYNICVPRVEAAPHHDWVYWPRLTRDETLVWVGYDSAAPRAVALHTAFWDESAPATARPRESFEVRVVCLLDDVRTVFLPKSKLSRELGSGGAHGQEQGQEPEQETLLQKQREGAARL